MNTPQWRRGLTASRRSQIAIDLHESAAGRNGGEALRPREASAAAWAVAPQSMPQWRRGLTASRSERCRLGCGTPVHAAMEARPYGLAKMPHINTIERKQDAAAMEARPYGLAKSKRSWASWAQPSRRNGGEALRPREGGNGDGVLTTRDRRNGGEALRPREGQSTQDMSTALYAAMEARPYGLAKTYASSITMRAAEPQWRRGLTASRRAATISMRELAIACRNGGEALRPREVLSGGGAPAAGFFRRNGGEALRPREALADFTALELHKHRHLRALKILKRTNPGFSCQGAQNSLLTCLRAMSGVVWFTRALACCRHTMVGPPDLGNLGRRPMNSKHCIPLELASPRSTIAMESSVNRMTRPKSERKPIFSISDKSQMNREYCNE